MEKKEEGKEETWYGKPRWEKGHTPLKRGGRRRKVTGIDRVNHK